MPARNFIKPFKIVGNMPEEIIIFSYGQVFGYCNNNRQHGAKLNRNFTLDMRVGLVITYGKVFKPEFQDIVHPGIESHFW